MSSTTFLSSVLTSVVSLGACACVSCSGPGSGQSAPASDTGQATTLDGLWAFEPLPNQLFNASFATGLLLARGGSFKAALYKSTRPGLNATHPCTAGSDVSYVDIELTPASGNRPGSGIGTVSAGMQGDPCAETAAIYDIVATQTRVQPPTLTPYDGDWTLAFHDASGASMYGDASLTLHVAGGSWTVGGPVHASGTVTLPTASGTDGESVVGLRREPDDAKASDVYFGP